MSLETMYYVIFWKQFDSMKGFCHSDELTDNLIFIQAIIRAAAFNSIRVIVDQTVNESAGWIQTFRLASAIRDAAFLVRKKSEFV